MTPNAAREAATSGHGRCRDPTRAHTFITAKSTLAAAIHTMPRIAGRWSSTIDVRDRRGIESRSERRDTRAPALVEELATRVGIDEPSARESRVELVEVDDLVLAPFPAQPHGAPVDPA